MIEAALTDDWDYNGFPSNPFGLYAQDIISQMIMLINRIRGIAYRSTEKKTLIYNATTKFKLSNLVEIYIFIDFLSPVRSLYLNKIFFRQLEGMTAGGKIETKISLKCQTNPNFRAYRSGRSLLAFELSSHLTTTRYFTTSASNKSGRNRKGRNANGNNITLWNQTSGRNLIRMTTNGLGHE